MEYNIYGRNFYDGVMIVVSQEVDNPQYDGKAYPYIEVLRNTAEIVNTGFMAKDDDFWADAFVFSPGGQNSMHAFVHAAFGSKEKISAILDGIITK